MSPQCARTTPPLPYPYHHNPKPTTTDHRILNLMSCSSLRIKLLSYSTAFAITRPSPQFLAWRANRPGLLTRRTFCIMPPPKRPRQFRPLDPAKQVTGDTRPILKGIVFDVDGTLCESKAGPFNVEYLFSRSGHVHSLFGGHFSDLPASLSFSSQIYMC